MSHVWPYEDQGGLRETGITGDYNQIQGMGGKSHEMRGPYTVDSISSFIDGGTHISKDFDPMNSIFCMILI